MIDRGFYFKFNANIDIKLVRYTLEDNGLSSQQNQGERQGFNGRNYMDTKTKNAINDSSWLLTWSTQSLKPGFFQSLTKHQKVN